MLIQNNTPEQALPSLKQTHRKAESAQVKIEDSRRKSGEQLCRLHLAAVQTLQKQAISAEVGSF